MTITLDSRMLVILAVLLALMLLLSGGQRGCQMWVGCLVGLVCIAVGIVLLVMSGWIG